jgi:hypothetical protein
VTMFSGIWAFHIEGRNTFIHYCYLLINCISFPEVRVWPNDQTVSTLHLPVYTLSYTIASIPTSITDTHKQIKQHETPKIRKQTVWRTERPPQYWYWLGVPDFIINMEDSPSGQEDYNSLLQITWKILKYNSIYFPWELELAVRIHDNKTMHNKILFNQFSYAMLLLTSLHREQVMLWVVYVLPNPPAAQPTRCRLPNQNRNGLHYKIRKYQFPYMWTSRLVKTF